MNNKITQFDHYLTGSGPAALVIREYLVPVEGADGVLFPPTFASGDGFPGGYNIDGDLNGENIALIDSLGSQANRIEPMFAEPNYAALVPQVIIKAGAKSVSLLQAGHRAGDAIVRCSALQQEFQDAFKKLLDGDATALAKIAPTSLVFGVWDSRDTQAKMPRLIASTIRAFNVRKLTRSAQFVPATDYVGGGLLDEPADKAAKDRQTSVCPAWVCSRSRLQNREYPRRSHRRRRNPARCNACTRGAQLDFGRLEPRGITGSATLHSRSGARCIHATARRLHSARNTPCFRHPRGHGTKGRRGLFRWQACDIQPKT